MGKIWKVYLSGEVHSDWRQSLAALIKEADLPVDCFGPVTDHEASDACGATIMGDEADKFWHDHKGAKLNTIRNKVLLGESDLVIVRFGDKYKQWNAAFDAGYVAALGKPLIVQHPPEFIHALKEVDAQALAVVEDEQQLVQVLKYIVDGKPG